ncbi:MAG: alpha/beta hydrolase [Clostridiales bacterium]|nr:alpha/beta hydrolase [Candidatus Coliplasma caballi]
MGLIENAIIKIVKHKMHRELKLDEATEISSEGIDEFRNIPYTNRVGKELFMDIYKPKDDDPSREYPVVVNVHGGGLISGSKNLSAGFCRLFAQRGFLVFSLEYRLVPAVKVYEQLDDVCAGMDCVGRKLVDFNVDFRRIFMVAESAGAYLALYTAAMKRSEVLQKAIGYEPSRMSFKALGLISGMFYTTRKDATGIFLSRSFYGKDEKSRAIAQYTNPEHPEIIYNIPPVYLITSKADMLERYTLDFAGELGNKGIEHKLRHMGSYKRLLHAFPVIRPDLPESIRVVDEITEWFREHSPADARD